MSVEYTIIELQREIDYLRSVISDMEEAIPKLIEGARKPLLDEIEKLSTGGLPS